MVFLQFVQQPVPRLELQRLVGQAERYFSAELVVLAQDSTGCHATLQMKTRQVTASFELCARLASVADRQRLRP
ncbi:MAG TPA: hypothetical protein VFU02_03830, partial [Polyangiaceae bacterium]|nr:hypothetical protein [Polyangiaceae bacterium]